MSSFSWLDYSETDRRQMLDVIQLFREPGTLDELGIGTVRDALADRLFPGTSTIQTRAKYFLFVSWIYRDMERRRVSSSRISEKARAAETRLMNALAQSHPGEMGIIGINAGANLKRLPSNIYWRGLQVWGLRLFAGSQSQYHESLDRFYAKNRQHQQPYGDDEERQAPLHNWRPSMPDPPADFPDRATLHLAYHEAEYLVERIRSHVGNSLLAFLVTLDNSALAAQFPWQHPHLGELPSALQEDLEHARNFSEVIHGAALLYNHMLAEQWAKLGNGEELLATYRSHLSEWAGLIMGKSEALARWDWRVRFWQLVEDTNPSIHPMTRAFIESWLELVLVEDGAVTIAGNSTARELISNREYRLKRRLARLHNTRALELWSGESGASQLNYRWNIVQTLLGDISHGLNTQEREGARAQA